MSEGNAVGWFAVNALSAALLFLVLIFFDPLRVLANDRNGAALLMTGLTVVAALLGASSFRTKPGRVGAIGGVVLLVLIGLGWAFFSISWTSPTPTPGPGQVAPAGGGPG
jgi:hypothetical protein